MRMRVLIVGHSYLAEENRKQLIELARFVEVQVVTPTTFKGMVFNYEHGVLPVGEGWALKGYRKFNLPGFPEGAYFLASKDFGMRDFKPDIIHIEGDPFTTYFVQTYLLSRIFARHAKIVCTVKQNTFTSRGWLFDYLKSAVAKLLVPKVSRIVAVNEGVERMYLDRFGARPGQIVRCTHLGVDCELFRPLTRSNRERKRGPVLGYCGRLVKYKGLDELIYSVKQLLLTGHDEARLIVLGDGPMREELECLSLESDWLEVRAPVPHDRVAEFLDEIDCFVMPSHRLNWHEEHDAHAVMEAMACEILCIVSDSGANPEVLDNCGIIVDSNNGEALAKGLLSALARRGDYSKARKRVLEHYSVQAVAAQLANTYEEAISR
jgi:glycosyltransferase involved in cell wall biosynthesis